MHQSNMFYFLIMFHFVIQQKFIYKKNISKFSHEIHKAVLISLLIHNTNPVLLNATQEYYPQMRFN